MRRSFHDDLAVVDAHIVTIFDLVVANVRAARAALAGEAVDAGEVDEREQRINLAEHHVESEVERLFALQQPVAGDLRFLLTAVRTAPELERCGDLAEHLVHLAGRLPLDALDVHGEVLLKMGEEAVSIWELTRAAWISRDCDLAAASAPVEDRLDQLHRRLLRGLRDSDLRGGSAWDVTLVGRFWERLGDHALHLSERIVYLVCGREEPDAI
jgi:phosphate transport system protein